MKRGAGDSRHEGLPSATGGHYPETSYSLIGKIKRASGREKQELLNQLITSYYEPIYRFFQRVLDVHGERLKDVTQDFFTRFVEKDFLKYFTYEKSFRNFLKVACRRHYINWLDAERVRKEPGGRKILPMPDPNPDPPVSEERTSRMVDEELRQDYIRRSIQRLREALAAEGKEKYFRVFEMRTRFEGEKPTDYETISQEVGVRVYDVRNYLSAARKKFREILVDLAFESSEDPKSELRDLGLAKYL